MKEEMELTLLSLENVFGKFVVSAPNKLSGCLDVIKKYGATAIATDLALATGAFVTDTKNNECEYFLKDFWSFNRLAGINRNGEMITLAGTRRSSIRPVLVPSNFDSSFSSNDEIVEYGEYPQDAASLAMQKELNDALIHHNLLYTGREYTLDETSCIEEKPFSPNAFFEFEYKNKKYICVKVDSFHYEVQLSNGGKYYRGNEVWIEVSPVRWLVDHKAKKLVSSKVLLSGIRACSEKNPINHFGYSEIKEYLDKYMLSEMFDHCTLQKSESVSQANKQTAKVKKAVNPYGLTFDKVTEEDIIKGAIISNVPVFLHGPSSEGKSARVKQIDPDCEIIYLRNATPESLNGKSVYNQSTGEMIDLRPTWLKKLKVKCDQEPDKLHIVFFDELTNALPSIQGMAFNIILDREVNGIWKLPKNARIVASGNEMEDSLAANQLAEPLFNRFAHVYIKTTTSSWLKWASDNNIHPAIYAYIAYKNGETLRSKYDGKSPNADPRKWEMASKMLYQTGNPYMLRSLVGEEITKEFVTFCDEEIITLDDVINGNYTEEEVQKLNTAKRYATTMGLTSVSEEHLEVVRNFARKLGSEYRAIFDTLWTHNDESRIERIALLDQDTITSENVINTDDIELTLLSSSEIWDGEISGSKKLDVLKKYGIMTPITDLAILTGSNYGYNSILFDSNKIRPCSIFTRTLVGDTGVVISSIEAHPTADATSQSSRWYAIRPVIKSSSLFDAIFPNRISSLNETYEVAFGEYPQNAASKKVQTILEAHYLENNLLMTGKTYTFDGTDINTENEKEFQPDVYYEYEYKGRKYIRFKVRYIHNPRSNELSNGIEYQIGDSVWLEVEPIMWLIDSKNKQLIAKNGLLSGIRINGNKKSCDGDFKKTEMYEFLNTYLKQDILSNQEKAIIKTLKR